MSLSENEKIFDLVTIDETSHKLKHYLFWWNISNLRRIILYISFFVIYEIFSFNIQSEKIKISAHLLIWKRISPSYLNETVYGINIWRIEINLIFLIESIWKFWSFNVFRRWYRIKLWMIFKIFNSLYKLLIQSNHIHLLLWKHLDPLVVSDNV